MSNELLLKTLQPRKGYILMVRDLLRRLIRRQKLLKPREYERALQKYRQAHPETLVEEREQILRWIKYVEARNRLEKQNHTENRVSEEEARIAKALYALREVARAAFMRHPASTEYDFLRCWPSIRQEVLKQHALEELASNPELSSRLPGQLSEESVMSSTRASEH